MAFITGLADHAAQQQEEANSRGLQLAKEIAQVCCHNLAEGVDADIQVPSFFPAGISLSRSQLDVHAMCAGGAHSAANGKGSHQQGNGCGPSDSICPGAFLLCTGIHPCNCNFNQHPLQPTHISLFQVNERH